jgi:hypothetical protein
VYEWSYRKHGSFNFVCVWGFISFSLPFCRRVIFSPILSYNIFMFVVCLGNTCFFVSYNIHTHHCIVVFTCCCVIRCCHANLIWKNNQICETQMTNFFVQQGYHSWPSPFSWVDQPFPFVYITSYSILWLILTSCEEPQHSLFFLLWWASQK